MGDSAGIFRDASSIVLMQEIEAQRLQMGKGSAYEIYAKGKVDVHWVRMIAGPRDRAVRSRGFSIFISLAMQEFPIDPVSRDWLPYEPCHLP